MQLIYKDRDVQKILEDPNKIQKKIGKDFTKTLIRRTNELKAAENFNQYLTRIGLGKPHPLKGKLDKCYGIHISSNYRLVVEPICEALDMESLKKCEVLNIKGVLDYHDGKNEWIIP